MKLLEKSAILYYNTILFGNSIICFDDYSVSYNNLKIDIIAMEKNR